MCGSMTFIDSIECIIGRDYAAVSGIILIYIQANISIPTFAWFRFGIDILYTIKRSHFMARFPWHWLGRNKCE